MGKKTVRWKNLKQTPGHFTCTKCYNHGTIQETDWLYMTTYYYYCDCYYGRQEKENESRRNETLYQ